MRTRVTSNYSIDQALLRSQSLRVKLEAARAKITSNKSILRPSEAPDQISPRASLNAAIGKIDADVKNIEVANARLNQSNQVIRDIISVVTSAKTVALSAESGPERALQAGEVDAILKDLLRLANSSYDGEYLFSGTSTGEKPYNEVRRDTDGKIIAAEYLGSDQRSQMVIHGTPIDVRYVGTDVFTLSTPLGTAVTLGATGVQKGQGVGSAKGVVDIQLVASGASFAGGSGVASGATAATGNTILGANGTNSLRIVDTSGTGAAGTVSLNNGEPVAFTNANTDLRVLGPLGETIYLNMSAITAGFDGTVAIQSDGTVSIDGGVTSFALTYSTDQVITNADGTRMVNLNTSQVVRAGNAAIDQEGNASLFQTVAQLRDDLLNTRQLSDTQIRDALERRIGDLTRHIDKIGATLGDQSVTLENLQDIKTQSEDLRLTYKESLSTLEDADLVTLAVQLKADETRLQYSFSAMSSLFDVSLLNFLR